MAKHVVWVAGHGPDRSHDSLESAVFKRKKDADEFVKGKKYWRISRLEYTREHEPWTDRLDEVGGEDVDKSIEEERQRLMFETGRRIGTAEAAASLSKQFALMASGSVKAGTLRTKARSSKRDAEEKAALARWRELSRTRRGGWGPR